MFSYILCSKCWFWNGSHFCLSFHSYLFGWLLVKLWCLIPCAAQSHSSVNSSCQYWNLHACSDSREGKLQDLLSLHQKTQSTCHLHTVVCFSHPRKAVSQLSLACWRSSAHVSIPTNGPSCKCQSVTFPVALQSPPALAAAAFLAWQTQMAADDLVW